MKNTIVWRWHFIKMLLSVIEPASAAFEIVLTIGLLVVWVCSWSVKYVIESYFRLLKVFDANNNSFWGHAVVVVVVYLHRKCRRTSIRSVEFNKRISFPPRVSCSPPPVYVHCSIYTNIVFSYSLRASSLKR